MLCRLACACLALMCAAPAAGQVLGQIPADYEVHGELILVAGQIEGFAEACGFGRKPDRGELMAWYAHHRLARSLAKLNEIYDFGVALGRDSPCEAGHYQALVARWDTLLTRTRAFVETYR